TFVMADGGESHTPTGENTTAPEEATGCKHYKRRCKLISPCCRNNYICRFCHDEAEDHTLDRPSITEIECLSCSERQQLGKICKSCSITFGYYVCLKCKLFDDTDKKQYHCEGCGLCRVGGRDNFFHCTICEMCLPNGIADSHKCIEKVSRGNCPLCLEDIHTSRTVSHVPPCGHLIHRPCFQDLIKAGFYACPTCGVSMVKMEELWSSLDQEIERTPMPTAYAKLFCNALCKDCHKEELTEFHILGLKCHSCGSYNTVRSKGGLFKKKDADEGGGLEEADVEEADTNSPTTSSFGAEGVSEENYGAEGFSEDSEASET
ncbi:unnamed protein product, partial [Meganyctiphanes norvegica]